MSQPRSPEISLDRPAPVGLPPVHPSLRSVPAAVPLPLLPLIFMALLLLLNGLLWIHLIPAGHAPDESNHQSLIDFIVRNHRLSVLGGPGRQGDFYLENLPVIPDNYVTHPPGGYIVSAAVAPWLPAQRPDIPYRLGSLLCLLLALPVMVAAVRLLFPSSRALQIAVPLICLLIPQVTFVGAYANADAFGLLCGAFFTYALCGGICRSWSLWRTMIFGLALGLMLLARLNGYAMIPIFGLGFLLTAKPTAPATPRRRWIGLAWRAVLVAMVALAVSGWWFSFNHRIYGEWIPLKTLSIAQTAVHGGPYHTPRDDGFTYLSVLLKTGWLDDVFRSAIGLFDWVSLPLPGCVYKTAFVIIAIAAVALLLGALVGAGAVMMERIAPRTGAHQTPAPAALFPDAHPRLPLLLGLFAAALVALMFLVLHVALTRDFQAQGRYLFPGLLGGVILLVTGLRLPLTLLPAKISARSGGMVAGFLATLIVAANVYASVFVIAPQYPPLPESSLIPALAIVAPTPSIHLVVESIRPAPLHGFFVHGGCSVRVPMIPAGKYLSLSVGIDPKVQMECGGVRFLIYVDDGQGTHMVLDRTMQPRENPADRTFSPAIADFSAYVGRPVTVIWTVEPVATTANNWAVFLDPRWAN